MFKEFDKFDLIKTFLANVLIAALFAFCVAFVAALASRMIMSDDTVDRVYDYIPIAGALVALLTGLLVHLFAFRQSKKVWPAALVKRYFSVYLIIKGIWLIPYTIHAYMNGIEHLITPNAHPHWTYWNSLTRVFFLIYANVQFPYAFFYMLTNHFITGYLLTLGIYGAVIFAFISIRRHVHE